MAAALTVSTVTCNSPVHSMLAPQSSTSSDKTSQWTTWTHSHTVLDIARHHLPLKTQASPLSSINLSPPVSPDKVPLRNPLINSATTQYPAADTDTYEDTAIPYFHDQLIANQHQQTTTSTKPKPKSIPKLPPSTSSSQLIFSTTRKDSLPYPDLLLQISQKKQSSKHIYSKPISYRLHIWRLIANLKLYNEINYTCNNSTTSSSNSSFVTSSSGSSSTLVILQDDRHQDINVNVVKSVLPLSATISSERRSLSKRKTHIQLKPGSTISRHHQQHHHHHEHSKLHPTTVSTTTANNHSNNNLHRRRRSAPSASSNTSSSQPQLSIVIHDPDLAQYIDVGGSTGFRIATSPLQFDITEYILLYNEEVNDKVTLPIVNATGNRGRRGRSVSAKRSLSLSPTGGRFDGGIISSSGHQDDATSGEIPRGRSQTATQVGAASISTATVKTSSSKRSQSLSAGSTHGQYSQQGSGSSNESSASSAAYRSLLVEAQMKLGEELSAEESLRIVLALKYGGGKGNGNRTRRKDEGRVVEDIGMGSTDVEVNESNSSAGGGSKDSYNTTNESILSNEAIDGENGGIGVGKEGSSSRMKVKSYLRNGSSTSGRNVANSNSNGSNGWKVQSSSSSSRAGLKQKREKKGREK
ncbi:hypothetical protein HDU76_011754 [Blyttiomyces sp. JEL0837]|nr:hypothetical protein HDU76_011754 [Blyttiomyces sp. JEL0837]